jgi:hypothetical protein
MVIAEHKTASVAYINIKIQLSGFSVYPDGLSSKFYWTNGVLLYFPNTLAIAEVSNILPTE